MTTTVVSNAVPFGVMTNRTVADLYRVNLAILRLQAAVASAASGFSGTAGTEYEDEVIFGVAPSATPGAKGSDFAFAVNTIGGAWATFWSAAQGAIEALDNGLNP